MSTRALLESPQFATAPCEQHINICILAVAALGLPDGGCWPRLLAAGAALGLMPCPLETAAHLRLLNIPLPEDQGDPLTGSGRAPAGALTVMSLPPSPDPQSPRGFYLRDTAGLRWLRGYRCDDEHIWQPSAHLVWQISEAG